MKTKTWFKRAYRTFGQAALGYIVANVAFIKWDEDGAVLKSALIGLGVSAVAAGVAAVMNYKDNS